MDSTESVTEILWDKLWDDMPYEKTQVKRTTTTYRVIEKTLEEWAELGMEKVKDE